MAILRSLRIHRYLDVEPTTLEFHPRRNLLLGVNGGGKTTLLNLIAMVQSLEFSALAQTEFSIGFVQQHADWNMEIEVSNELRPFPGSLSLPSVGGLRMEKSFAGQASIRIRDTAGSEIGQLATDGERTTLTKRGVAPVTPDGLRLSPFSATTFHFAAALLQRPIAYHDTPLRFDEGLDLFREIHSDDKPRFTVMNLSSGSLKFVLGLCPQSASVVLMSHSLNLVERLTFDSAEHEFLSAFVDASGFDRVRLVADLIERAAPDATGSFEEKFRLTLYCARGEREFIQNELSFGQKRLWAFLYYLASNTPSVIADELVNGMHHRWIKLCVERIGDRQAFLTSQNPLLFDFIPLGTASAPGCTFVRCDLASPRMRWRNLDSAETGRLYEAYEAGIEPIGEILQTRGLW